MYIPNKITSALFMPETAQVPEKSPCRQPSKILAGVVDLLVCASHRPSCWVAGRLRIRPHGLNTANTAARSRAVGETIGGKIRLPTTSEAGSPAANRQPCSAALLTSGRNAIGTSAVSTMFSTSLIATHQYRTRPYLVPSPRTTPLARQTRPAVSSGQTAKSSSAWKQSALVLSSSASRARKITTAMTTSIPIHTPADTMCTTRTPLRVRAPNRHGRALPSVGLVIEPTPSIDHGVLVLKQYFCPPLAVELP